jgi:hypothetical protein
LFPELFELVKLALIGRKKVDNDVAEIDHKPTVAGSTFVSPHQAKILLGFLDYGIRQAVQHAVTGPVAQDEKISKGCDFVNIQEQKIFRFFFFQGINESTSNLKS